MKSSVPPAVAIVVIVIAIAIAGFFAYRTLGARPAASQDLTKNADFSALINMTDEQKAQMKRDFENAKAGRGDATK